MPEFHDQNLIQDSVTRLFMGEVSRPIIEGAERGTWPQALWRAVGDAGLGLALATESSGGLALGWREAYPVLHGLGYSQAPVPLAETLIASHLLSNAEIPIPGNRTDGTPSPIALIDEKAAQSLRLTGTAQTVCVEGVVSQVAWARWCDHALIGFSDGRCALVSIGASSSVSITEGCDSAGMPADTLRFPGAPCAAVFEPGGGAYLIRLLGAAARAAMMSGAAQWALEQSVHYAQDRVQFGKPIGRNQALQQMLAKLAGEVAAARMATQAACADLDAGAGLVGQAARFSVSVAKIRAGEAAGHAIAISHQVHGAMGFTREHALQFATRRLWAWRREFGTEAWWAEQLGRAAIKRGADGLWPGLTARDIDPLA